MPPNHIEVICPSCAHHQMEPAKVVSTVCRTCGYHISLLESRLQRSESATPKLATEEKPPIQTHYPSSNEPVLYNKSSFFKKLIKRTQAKHRIDCFHCGHIYEVVKSAQSTQCPKCVGYISLENYEVRTDWRRSIQTRGNVIIHKDGSIIGVKVQCHDLTVLGTLSASVHCSGTLLIRSNVKIIGTVSCEQLVVDKRAVVEIQGPLIAKKVIINGVVTAHITCHGSIVLGKNSQLQGEMRARSFTVREGAKHTGSMMIISETSSSGL